MSYESRINKLLPLSDIEKFEPSSSYLPDFLEQFYDTLLNNKIRFASLNDSYIKSLKEQLDEKEEGICIEYEQLKDTFMNKVGYLVEIQTPLLKNIKGQILENGSLDITSCHSYGFGSSYINVFYIDDLSKLDETINNLENIIHIEMFNNQQKVA